MQLFELCFPPSHIASCDWCCQSFAGGRHSICYWYATEGADHMVERQTRISGRQKHQTWQCNLNKGRKLSNVFVELLCLHRLTHGYKQSVLVLVWEDFPFLSGLGLQQTRGLHRKLPPYLTVRVRDSHDPLIDSWPDVSGSLCCTPSKTADTVIQIISFLPLSKTRSGRT